MLLWFQSYVALGNHYPNTGAVGSSVTFITWNVRLNATCIADTRIRRQWVFRSYHSLFNRKAQGDSVLIHRSILFIFSNVINECYVNEQGMLYNTPLVLARVYCPNHDNH